MQLSERQQRTVATAITIVAAIVIVASVLGLFLLLALFVQKFSGVLLPLAVAAIAALVFQPYYDWLKLRLNNSVPLAIIVMILSITIPILVFVGFFGNALIRELIDVVKQLPSWWQNFTQRVVEEWPEIQDFIPIDKKLADVVEGQSLGDVMHYLTAGFGVGANVAQRIGGLFSWAVTPVYFVFFLITERKDVSRLENHLPFLKSETREDVVFLIQEFVNIVVAFFRGQIIIAFLQGLLYAIGFSIVGLKYGAVLGLALGFLNVIPYLGSMVGLSVTLPLAYFQEGGGLGTLCGVIIVIIIVQLIEGYVLTPKIMGDRTGLHPMAIIFAIFFWGTALGGIMGMILAIPLTAFLVVFWRLVKEKYIAEIM